ncbi:DNA/RNA non-specific endonuclease [Amycolatopsis sulphurea]|nr:DNA/RNA non-specific endonuclease [Amycolatopsis sulphurea]
MRRLSRRPRRHPAAIAGWNRGFVVAMTAALLAVTAGEGAGAAVASEARAVHGQWQPPAKKPPAVAAHAAVEPDPDDAALIKQMQRDLVTDIADHDEEQEVRDAARDTLRRTDAGDAGAIDEFFAHGNMDARAKARKRKADADAANRALIEPLAGQGGPEFNAAVERALKGDARARESFLAYERDIAAERDRKNDAFTKEYNARRRGYVQMVADLGGPEVSAAAKAALAQGDAAIEQFFATGYLEAAKRDADAREKQVADLERQRKEAEAASDLAQRTARAMTARRNLLSAHADGIRALERAANDMTAAANTSREIAKTLAADQAGHSYHPELYQRAKDEVARHVANAAIDAQRAQSAAGAAAAQATILVQNGMPHGSEWATVVQAMAASATAAKQAADTASHAVDAISADAAATDASEKAKTHEENARQWRANAEVNAAAARQLAQAAADQAAAAATAAERAKQSHADALTALRQAQEHAQNVKDSRAAAERERDTAAAKRAEAEINRQQAAAKRAEAEAKQREAAHQRDIAVRQANVAAQKRREAERQADIAAQKRGSAQQQEQIAADRNKDARHQEQAALDADTDARTQELNANRARDYAAEVAKSAETLNRKAQVLEGLAQKAQGMVQAAQGDKDRAWAAAHQARADADQAAAAARQARSDADAAGTAAVNARSAAIQANSAASNSRAAADRAQAAASQARAAADAAEAAAERARTAATEAQAAAARADQDATRAESEAALTHQAAMRAEAAAAEATAAEARAAQNARAAADLAQQTAVKSAQALEAAQRTQDEANASAVEASTAALQAGIATRAASAAVQSASGIANPADSAIGMAAPFADTDVDADFAQNVANRARDTGASQVDTAQAAAKDAAERARIAAEAAKNASGEVAPAYQAASDAAESASTAARSAADAQASAAEAAKEAAGARQAAADANVVDTQAQADAQAARAAANQAAADAALAGLSADQAEADARAARHAADNATRAANEASAAATRAANDAAAAQRAAAQAAKDAEAARAAADRAQQHADDANDAATNAENYARDAETRAKNAAGDAKDIQAELAKLQDELRKADEEEQRKAAEEAINDDSDVPALTADEETALRKAKGQQGVDDYNTNRAKANAGLMGFITEQGGQVLLDLIGYTDAKKCFTEGDFISCIMTVVNALPLAKFVSVLSKIPDAVSATVRIVKGIRSFKDAIVTARRITTNLRNYVRQLINCRGLARRATTANAPCTPIDKEEELKKPTPKVDPAPGIRLDPTKDKKKLDDCANGTMPADTTINDPLESFTYLGDPAQRARGGITCIVTPKMGSAYRADPAGFDPRTMQRGHLIPRRFNGPGTLANIVNQYIKVNHPVISTIERAVAKALSPGGDTEIVYRVSVQYPSNTAWVPEWIFIDAIGNHGYYCRATIENVPDANGNIDTSGCY